MTPTATASTGEFLSHKKLALVRLSPQTPVMGAHIDKELASKGYEVPVVYLSTTDVDTTLGAVKDQVEGAIIAVPKSRCEAAVREALDAGIPRLWLQAGCDSKEAVALCEESGVPCVHGACVMMYTQPVQSVHAFHRGLWKLFGQLQQ
jgi:predicted CoA-binding protein